MRVYQAGQDRQTGGVCHSSARWRSRFLSGDGRDAVARHDDRGPLDGRPAGAVDEQGVADHERRGGGLTCR